MPFLIAFARVTLQGDLRLKQVLTTFWREHYLLYLVLGNLLKATLHLLFLCFISVNLAGFFGKREIIANALLFNMLVQNSLFRYNRVLNVSHKYISNSAEKSIRNCTKAFNQLP